MELSLFLAKAWGLIIVIMATAMLFKHQSAKALIADMDSPIIIYIVAIFALIIGVISILLHNIWTPDYRFLVTVLGWTALIKGIFLLFFPRLSLKWAKDAISVPTFMQVVLITKLIIGIFLLLVGLSY